MRSFVKMAGGFVVLMLFAANSQAGVTIWNTWVQTPTTLNFDGSDYYTHTITVSSDVGDFMSYRLIVWIDNEGDALNQLTEYLSGNQRLYWNDDYSETELNQLGYSKKQDTHMLVDITETHPDSDFTSGHFGYSEDNQSLVYAFRLDTPESGRDIAQIVVKKNTIVTVELSAFVLLGDTPGGLYYHSRFGHVDSELDGGFYLIPEPASLLLLFTAGLVVLSCRK